MESQVRPRQIRLRDECLRHPYIPVIPIVVLENSSQFERLKIWSGDKTASFAVHVLDVLGMDERLSPVDHWERTTDGLETRTHQKFYFEEIFIEKSLNENRLIVFGKHFLSHYANSYY